MFDLRSSRRATLRSLVTAGIGTVLATLIKDGIEAKTKTKRRNTRCASPRVTCGTTCVTLNTAANCGRCGNRCSGSESCRDGICCQNELCRGECRPDCPPPIANVPFPRHVNYGANTITPSNFTQAERDSHVQAANEKLKAHYLVPAGRDATGRQLFRIAFGKPNTDNHTVTVSEGQGYGMVIVAHMAGHDPEAQEIFDGLWRFRLAHPSEIDGRLMDWRVPAGDGNDSAFDGDCDMAYGLLLADAQFGSGGAIDYRAAFDRTIAGILESTIGLVSRLPMLGDWVSPNGATYNQHTPRTSDFMPGHFRAFGRATSDGVWNTVVEASQDIVDILQTNGSPVTGLLPDFVQEGPRPASPGFLEGPHRGDYFDNAGRDPWRLGTDALLNGDPHSARQARKITEWAETATGGDPRAIRAGYRLDGSTWPDTEYFTTFFAAPLGVAAMTDRQRQDWLNAIYEAVYDVSEDYFEDSVTLLCLLVMTGNFWDPTVTSGGTDPRASVADVQKARLDLLMPRGTRARKQRRPET